MAAKYNIRIQYSAWVAVCTLATVVAMTTVHLKLELSSLDAATRKRAELTALSLAKSVESALATNDLRALPAIVVHVVSDDDIYYTQILNKHGEPVYPTRQEREPTGLVLVAQPVGDPAKPVGKVEVGIAPTDLSRTLQHTVWTDLLVGLVLVVAATAVSAYASAPVRQALAELQHCVDRVARGAGKPELLESDLAEVDQVGQTLNRLMSQVREAQLSNSRAQKELKAAQKEMDEYTYVISHDLKEPLRGIEAFSKFLMEDHREKLNDDGRHHIDVIRNSALRMQRLINDLLKFSRLGQQKNPLAPVGLNTMLMHVRLNLQYALDAKKVDLQVDKLPTVLCDATAMTEVFHNLISNAIKYNDKPRPVVEVGCTEQHNAETDRDEYVLHVRDNGPGIKAEYYEKIFQLFQRLHRDDEGTGIGLTIVKRVVEWHGGRIWIESIVGEGTTFFFTLPKQDTGQPTSRTAEPAPASKGEPQLATTV